MWEKVEGRDSVMDEGDGVGRALRKTQFLLIEPSQLKVGLDVSPSSLSRLGHRLTACQR